MSAFIIRCVEFERRSRQSIYQRNLRIKMCRVKSCLGCLKLETFGLIVGWGSFVGALAVAVPMIFLIVFGFSELGNKISINVFSKLYSSFNCIPGRTVIGACIVILIFCCLLVYVCLELIEGIETVSNLKAFVH